MNGENESYSTETIFQAGGGLCWANTYTIAVCLHTHTHVESMQKQIKSSENSVIYLQDNARLSRRI